MKGGVAEEVKGGAEGKRYGGPPGTRMRRLTTEGLSPRGRRRRTLEVKAEAKAKVASGARATFERVSEERDRRRS